MQACCHSRTQYELWWQSLYIVHRERFQRALAIRSLCLLQHQTILYNNWVCIIVLKIIVLKPAIFWNCTVLFWEETLHQLRRYLDTQRLQIVCLKVPKLLYINNPAKNNKTLHCLQKQDGHQVKSKLGKSPEEPGYSSMQHHAGETSLMKS